MSDIATMENSSTYRAAYLAALLAPRRLADNDGQPLQSPQDDGRRAVFTARDVYRLQAITAAAKRAAVRSCNYGHASDAAESRYSKAADKRQAEADAIAARYGLRADIGGDPRGACGRLIDPADAGKGDGWGGGWPIW